MYGWTEPVHQVPIVEFLLVVQNSLEPDHSLDEEIRESDIYQQKEGLAMGSLLSPMAVTIYIEYFEEIALETALSKSRICLRYID